MSAEEFELRNRLTVVSITVARVDDCPEAFAEAAPESEAGQFWLLTSGCAVWQSGSRCHLARPGSLVHVPPRFPCHCHAVPGNHFSSLVARYKPGALPRQVSAPLVKLGLMTVTTDLMSEAQSASARSLMEDMLHETQQRHPGWQALVQAQLVQLAVRFQRSAMQSYASPPPKLIASADSLSRVADYAQHLNSSFSRPQSLAQAAGSVGLSRRRFTELFRQITKHSWRGYLESLRLQHAEWLLVNTSKPVTEIAFECAFDDVSHFDHRFKAVYGCSPRGYRNRHRGPFSGTARKIK